MTLLLLLSHTAGFYELPAAAAAAAASAIVRRSHSDSPRPLQCRRHAATGGHSQGGHRVAQRLPQADGNRPGDANLSNLLQQQPQLLVTSCLLSSKTTCSY